MRINTTAALLSRTAGISPSQGCCDHRAAAESGRRVLSLVILAEWDEEALGYLTVLLLRLVHSSAYMALIGGMLPTS